jgi:hypothetical protein
MQRSCEDVVKCVEVTRSQQCIPVEQAWVLLQFAQRFGHHGLQKHAGVNPAIEALPYGMPTRSKVQR